MNRFDICMMGKSDGMYVEHADVQAGLTEILVIAGRVPHENGCAIWTSATCDCVCGDLLASIEEMMR